MKLAALCCTYLRPAGLGQLIESFLRQDYPRQLRELVILDDAGQYENQTGEGWRLISVPHRFNSLGEKRNACAALASPDVEGFLVADDDDIYLPHWFRTQAEALKQADWSRPGLVLLEHTNGLREADTEGLYHGGWAFRKSIFRKVIGYGAHNNGEDQELARRLSESGASEIDPCTFAPPFYVYRYDNASYHLSYMDDQGYRDLGGGGPRQREPVIVGWTQNWPTLPVIRRFIFAPHVNHKIDRTPIELIGPVFEPGANGPQNGMYALQKELRKRIDEGLDWLSIKPLPVSKGAIPWFWNWQDRKYAMWWDAEGLPFIQGPNMLFINSATPRIDREECALLDSPNCLMMFCHSEWYRDLILANRGPNNKSEIVMWPYPIDPIPEGPLTAEYDLLIYAKNGHRPGLLEHLAELYPNHIQFHYGHYKRNDLIEAARRSRACAYLADDDHGPLALQEILLAGCPTVGVRTGASLVTEQATGLFVERLPPGQHHVETTTPLEQLESAFAKLQAAVVDELIDRLGKITPEFFEHVVVRLLQAMGYGVGTESGEVTSYVRDGGIDGIIREDKLGLDVVCIQAKRWQGTVGRPAVQAFVGSMDLIRAKKGVILTTGRFSEDATTFVDRIEGKRVVLIDGKRLAELMIEHDVGVSTKTVFKLKEVSGDFFEEGLDG